MTEAPAGLCAKLRAIAEGGDISADDSNTICLAVAVIRALAKSASPPAVGDVVLLKAMAEGAGSMLLDVQRECIELRQIVVGFLACPEIADCAPEDKDPETDALERRARRVALSQSTSAGRVGE